VTPSLRLPQDAGPLHGLSKPGEQVLLALTVSEFYEQANSLLRSRSMPAFPSGHSQKDTERLLRTP